MKSMLRKRRTLAVLTMCVVALVGSTASSCETNDADVVNENLNKEADNFKVMRRVVFYNAILDKYIMAVEGYCSVDPGNAERMTVTCKVGNEYMRHALGKSDNVLWSYEQLRLSNVSPNHYKMVYKPSTIIPDVEIR